MTSKTLERRMEEILAIYCGSGRCPVHGKAEEKPDSDASNKPNNIKYKLKGEKEENNSPEITLGFERDELNGSIKVVGFVKTLKQYILSFNSDGTVRMWGSICSEALQTDPKGYVKIKNLEEIVQSQPPKHPSVNGVEIWTVKDRDGAVQIRGKDETGAEAPIAWIETDGKLNRSLLSYGLKGISTEDGSGKIQMAN